MDERRPHADADQDADTGQYPPPPALAALQPAILRLRGLNLRCENLGGARRGAHGSLPSRPRVRAATRLKGSVSRIAKARSRGRSISTAARTRPGLAASTSTVSPR